MRRLATTRPSSSTANPASRRSRLEPAQPVAAAEDGHGLGRHLSRLRRRRHNGRCQNIGFRRPAGARVDEVMTPDVALPPAPVVAPRGRHASSLVSSAGRSFGLHGPDRPRRSATAPRPPSGPLTAMSPPASTSAGPNFPSRRTAWSAAHPLPIPPRSRPVPAGSRTLCVRGSRSMRRQSATGGTSRTATVRRAGPHQFPTFGRTRRHEGLENRRSHDSAGGLRRLERGFDHVP